MPLNDYKGKYVFSIALGCKSKTDLNYFKFLLVFLNNLQIVQREKSILKRWSVVVLLDDKFSKLAYMIHEVCPYAHFIRVIKIHHRLKAKKVSEYCLQRYFAAEYINDFKHKIRRTNGETQKDNKVCISRMVVLDVHYKWSDQNFVHLDHCIKNWKQSGKPLMMASSNNHMGNKPYNGGYVGFRNTMSTQLQKMQDIYKSEYLPEVHLNYDNKSQNIIFNNKYGCDELFIWWYVMFTMMQHDIVPQKNQATNNRKFKNDNTVVFACSKKVGLRYSVLTIQQTNRYLKPIKVWADQLSTIEMTQGRPKRSRGPPKKFKLIGM